MNHKTISKILLLIIILTSIYSTGCLWETRPSGVGKGSIISITIEPENPMPGDVITITLEAKNCSSAGYNIRDLFSNGPGGSGTDGITKSGVYHFKKGPYENSTEIWMMFSISGYDGNTVVSDEYFIQVGELEHSNKSSLSISNFTYTPENPTIDDRGIMISAEITGNVNIIEVEMRTMRFISNGASGGGGGRMSTEDGVTAKHYQSLLDDNGKQYPKGSMFFWIIVAKDDSGNMIRTPTLSLIL